MPSRKGSPNKTTIKAKTLASKVLTDGLESKLWAKFLNSEDEKIAFEAFKLAKAYKSGQPARAKEDNEALKGIVLTVRHIGGPGNSPPAEAK